MKSLCLIVVILLLAPAICIGVGGEAGKTGNYSVAVTWDKTRPALGPNRLELAVTDAASQPVPGAKVEIHYFMPSLPGKPPMMEYSTPARPIGGAGTRQRSTSP